MNIEDKLRSIEREQGELLKKEYVEPILHGPATLITAWSSSPATVVLLQPRRCLVQLDEIRFHAGNLPTFHRDPLGIIHGFIRRLNSRKWNYAGEERFNLLSGYRIYSRPELPGVADT